MIRRWLVGALCLAFSLTGIVLLIVGPADARLAGAITVLFFGVGGLALAMPALSRRGPGTVRIATIGAERAFVFPFGRAQRGLGVVAAFGVTAACALMAVTANPVVGGIGFAFFGGVLVYAVVTWRREQGLAITPTRVAALGGAELPWEAVAHVDIYTYRAARILGITATDRSLVKQRGPRWLASMNRLVVPADVAVSADRLATDPERVVGALTEYRDDPVRRAQIGTEAELARLR